MVAVINNKFKGFDIVKFLKVQRFIAAENAINGFPEVDMKSNQFDIDKFVNDYLIRFYYYIMEEMGEYVQLVNKNRLSNEFIQEDFDEEIKEACDIVMYIGTMTSIFRDNSVLKQVDINELFSMLNLMEVKTELSIFEDIPLTVRLVMQNFTNRKHHKKEVIDEVKIPDLMETGYHLMLTLLYDSMSYFFKLYGEGLFKEMIISKQEEVLARVNKTFDDIN